MQNRDLTGKPMQLVEKALKIDPKNWKALALAGTYSIDQGDYKKAIHYWQTLKSTLPTNSPMVKTLDAGIKEAEGKMKN
jgi:cytochrome c-type biogenesis protein CcmH